FSRIIVYGTLAAFFVGQLIFHLTLLGTIKTWRRGNRLKKTVLIVGSGETAIELTKELSASRTIDYEIVDYSGTDIGTAFDRYKIDELFIVMTSQEGENIKEMVETADYHGVRVYMVPAFYKLFKHNIRGNHLGAIPIINVNESPLDNYYNARYKQAFDILFSITVLMLIAPLLVVIGLLVKLTSRGPVFYVPRRVGVGGRVFKMYKFRTMRHGTEKQEDKPIKRNDSRVTWVGKFLRRFNLDELPQFFNVLKGDMSVVGPRPHRVYLNKVMQNSVEKYMVRHYIKPGITGWAQVNGWRGPTETEEQKTERTRHDLWYIKHWTLGVDIKIIFLTIIGRKTRKNAF
ncbi:MAG: exopolysaccharide biosynthesis polyprenyl glycosylphosphotransferase, partial [bacterium]|nr:exopolysaccharide biosynthesis polyprenyl glycosylphosphotransferase [bacterium]